MGDSGDYVHTEEDSRLANMSWFAPRSNVNGLEIDPECRPEVIATFLRFVFPALAVDQESSHIWTEPRAAVADAVTILQGFRTIIHRRTTCG